MKGSPPGEPDWMRGAEGRAKGGSTMTIETKAIPSAGPGGTRRRKPSRTARAAAALILAALVAAACVESGAAGPVIPLIPGNAVAAIVVESPYKLFSACDGFWKAAKLDQALGSGLEDLLAKSVPNADQAKQVLDFARPWALAVLPTQTPGKVDAALYVPYRADPEAFLDKILGSSSSLKVVAKAKNYAMIAEGPELPAFPTAKALDLKSLARYPVGSVKLWGDVGALAALAKDGYKPIEDAMRGFVTDPAEAAASAGSGGAGIMADPKKMLKAFSDIGMSLLEQLKTADAALVPSASGFAIRANVAPAAGSELQKSLAKLNKGASALDWASQVDADAFYGLSWAADPAFAAESKKILAPFLSALGLPKDAIDRVWAYQDKWTKVAGARGAMSFDFTIDPAAIAGASGMQSSDPAALADFMKKLMSFDVDAVMEVKSEAGYRALMKGYADDPDLKAFMKAYADLFGIEMAFTNEDKKEGSFSYGEIAFSMKVVDASKLGAADQAEAMNAALQAFGSMMRMRWAVSSGKCFITMGDVAALKALSGRKAAPKSIVSDPAFAAFSKTIPQKPVMILSMSMKKLMDMAGGVAGAAAAGAAGSAANPLAGLEGLGNWYGYASVDSASSLELGYLIPANDIGAIARFVVLMSSKAKAGGDA
jgi:hypothetical protein